MTPARTAYLLRMVNLQDTLDGRNQNMQALILDKYPAALANRLLNALVETQARLVGMGIITVSDGDVV